MPIPDFQSFLAPVLKLMADGAEHTSGELREKIAKHFNFTPEDLAERLPSGLQTIFDNRVSWSIVYLRKAGALESLKRGSYRVTGRGKELLRGNPDKLTVKILRQFPEFQAFHRRGTRQADLPETKSEVLQTPEERLQSAYEVLRAALANDVLEAVRKTSPSFFEKLVVELLVKMGYGGSVADAGKAVGRAGDQGIDGTIKEDKLGLDVVYVQAKRWKDVVGRPIVQAFAGSLEGARARKGVLITTSSFTPDAVDYVQRIEKKIVLIDGRQLASLMIEYNVGVNATETITLKRLDSDYFEST
jgi:restriction system protein